MALWGMECVIMSDTLNHFGSCVKYWSCVFLFLKKQKEYL